MTLHTIVHEQYPVSGMKNERKGSDSMEKEKKHIMLVIGITLILIYFVFRFLFGWILPVLLAFFVGNLLRPIIQFLQHKCHLPRSISVFLPIMLFFFGILWIVYYFGGLFCGQLVVFLKRIPYYQRLLDGELGNLCKWCDSLLLVKEGTVFSYFSLRMNKMFSWITEEQIPAFTLTAFEMLKKALGMLGTFGVVVILACMFVKDWEVLQEKYKNSLFYEELEKIRKPLCKTGIAYLKAQGILLVLVGTTCVLGFWLAGSHYAFLFGISVAVFDAFPIVGSGLVLVPFCVISLIRKKFMAAAIYGTTYLICQCIRQFLEPKLIGDRIGICPFYIMLSVYFGIRCFGVAGVILGPVSLVLLQAVLSDQM